MLMRPFAGRWLGVALHGRGFGVFGPWPRSEYAAGGCWRRCLQACGFNGRAHGVGRRQPIPSAYIDRWLVTAVLRVGPVTGGARRVSGCRRPSHGLVAQLVRAHA